MYSLRQPLHPSWLLAVFVIGFCVGVVCARWVGGVEFMSLAWLTCSVVLLGIALWRRFAYLISFMLVAGVILGLWRGGLYRQQTAAYERFFGDMVQIEGSIAEDPDENEKGNMVLRLHHISLDDEKLTGTIWVSLSDSSSVQRSDIVTVRGKLAEGFGSFVASMYRAELITAKRPTPGDVALRIRDWFAAGVRRAIPEPEASLGVGYILGQRRSLPDELDTALRAAGLTHIVVASGYNLTILVGLARRLFEGISKYLAAFFSAGMIGGFVAITGLSPSMSRAGLVAGLSLLAWYFGRRFHPLVLLVFAAAVTLMINPSYGWGDLGWQLSFASFAGVLMLAPLLQRYFYGASEPGVIRQVLGETISAWLCTLPLIVLAFGKFSNVAILANLLVLPLVPIAMLLTFVAGVFSLFIPWTASFIGIPASVVLGYMTKIASLLGNVPWAQTEMTTSPRVFMAFYIVLIGVSVLVWRQVRRDSASGDLRTKVGSSESRVL